MANLGKVPKTLLRNLSVNGNGPLNEPDCRGEYFYLSRGARLCLIFFCAEIFILKCFVQKYSYYGVLVLGRNIHLCWSGGMNLALKIFRKCACCEGFEVCADIGLMQVAGNVSNGIISQC